MDKQRKFYSNNDIGTHNTDAVFCYTQHNDTNNTLTVAYRYINSVIFEAEYPGKPNINASLSKDENETIKTLIYSVDEELYASKVKDVDGDFKLDEPVELEIQSTTTLHCMKSVISDNNIFVAFYNALDLSISVLCYTYPELKLKTARFAIPHEASSRYLDSITRQLNANVTLMSDENGGVFVQFLNATGSLDVCNVTLNSIGELESTLLFSVEASHIGYHNSIFDSASRLLVTTFTTVNPAETSDNVYAMTSKIFISNQAPTISNIGAIPISALLGHYYRPQIQNENSIYTISWEGNQDISWCSTDTNLSIVRPENRISGSTPGNHRLTLSDNHVEVSWHDNCLEPRFSGLEIKNYVGQE